MAGATNKSAKRMGYSQKQIQTERAKGGVLSHAALMANGAPSKPTKAYKALAEAMAARKQGLRRPGEGAPAGWQKAARGEGKSERDAATAARAALLSERAGKAKRGALAAKGARDLSGAMLASRKAEGAKRAAAVAARKSEGRMPEGLRRSLTENVPRMKEAAAVISAAGKPSAGNAFINRGGSAVQVRELHSRGPFMVHQDGDSYVVAHKPTGSAIVRTRGEATAVTILNGMGKSGQRISDRMMAGDVKAGHTLARFVTAQGSKAKRLAIAAKAARVAANTPAPTATTAQPKPRPAVPTTAAESARPAPTSPRASRTAEKKPSDRTPYAQSLAGHSRMRPKDVANLSASIARGQSVISAAGPAPKGKAWSYGDGKAFAVKPIKRVGDFFAHGTEGNTHIVHGPSGMSIAHYQWKDAGIKALNGLAKRGAKLSAGLSRGDESALKTMVRYNRATRTSRYQGAAMKAASVKRGASFTY